MNLEKEIFKKSTIIEEKLLTYGFIKDKDSYHYQKPIKNNFEVQVNYNSKEKEITTKVIDKEFNAEYTAFRVLNKGKFAQEIETEVTKILIDIKNKTTKSNFFIYNQSNRLTEYIISTYKTTPEFLWKNDTKNAVFRNTNNKKWFGLIMNVNRTKLDNIDEDIEALNLKLSEEKILKLQAEKGYYKAYHMNKKHWITIILNETVPDSIIKDLIEESYSYTL